MQIGTAKEMFLADKKSINQETSRRSITKHSGIFIAVEAVKSGDQLTGDT